MKKYEPLSKDEERIGKLVVNAAFKVHNALGPGLLEKVHEIDDLNKDGKSSMADAQVIYQVVEGLEGRPRNKFLIGGMGKYNKTSAHTWDVHIDTRGYRARW